MKAATANKGLGKGLQALMNDSYGRVEPAAPVALAGVAAPGGITMLALNLLIAGKYQPRRHFHDEELQELAESIRVHGVMQPLVVRAIENGYEIIAGERRFRAAKLAQLKEIPAIIRELSDSQALELGLIENIQRKDLNPLEEGAGYRRLMEEFRYTQEALAKIVGKSRSHVANLLRLETLPDRIKQYIDSGDLTMGHARALLSTNDPLKLAERIMSVSMSVRQAEELVREEKTGEAATKQADDQRGWGRPRARKAVEKSQDVQQLEQMLADNLGLQVSITTHSAKAGEVVISYESLIELDTILQRLGSGV